MHPSQHLKILCFGDSLTEGYSLYGLQFDPYSGMLERILTEKLNTEMPQLKALCFGASLTEGYTQNGTVFKPYSEEMGKVLEEKLNTDKGEAGAGNKGRYDYGDKEDKHENEEKGERWSISVDTEGVSGEMVLEMATRMGAIYADPANVKEPYDLVLFLGGTNDLGRGRAAEDIFFDIDKIIGIPLKHGARVVLLTIPECAAKVDWLNKRRDAVNEMMKKKADEEEDVFVFDLNKAIPYHSMAEAERKKIWDDGLHFTAKGYERLGALLAARVLGILGWEQKDVADGVKDEMKPETGAADMEGCEVWQ